jgi:hypothetical protein
MLGVKKRIRKYVTGDETKRVRDHFREKSSRPQYLKLVDKVSFTLGVLNISICQYFVCNTPHYFWIWYSFIIPILLYSRMKHFKRKGWHYFLLDFCYFTVLCTFIHLYIIPQSDLFFKVLFIYTNGPLCWAIVVWRNSFVFHDYDKITSVYIHLLPAILTFTENWHSYRSITNVHKSLGFSDYAFATLGYVSWQIFYYLKTEWLDRDKLDSNPHLLTSLRWLSKDEKNLIARKVLWLCRRVGIFGRREKYDSTQLKTKLVFMGTQFTYTVTSFLPTYLLYQSEHMHLAFLAVIMTVSIYYGASYYIEVFSERYHLQFKDASSVRKFAQATLQDAFESLQPTPHASGIDGTPTAQLLSEAADQLAEGLLQQMGSETTSGTSTPEKCD